MKILVIVILLLLPVALQAQKKFQMIAMGGFVAHGKPKGVTPQLVPQENLLGYAVAYQAKYRGFRNLSLGLGVDMLDINGQHPPGHTFFGTAPTTEVVHVSIATPVLSLYAMAEAQVRVSVIDIHGGIIAGGAIGQNGRPMTRTQTNYPASMGSMIGGIIGLGIDITKRWGIELDFMPRVHQLKFTSDTYYGQKMKITSYPVTLGLSFRL